MPQSDPSKHSTFGTSPKLYQRIVEILAGKITAGEIGSGDRLIENQIARQFGVSRAPVRQALAELARQELVLKSGRGYCVSDLALPVGVPKPSAESAQGALLTAPPSWQRSYAEVEDSITSRIAFGSWRVVETALAQHYGFSRTVAREVLARLQQVGLVRNEGRRWLAPALSGRRVEELYGLRAILEPAALAEAAPHVPPDLLEQMRDALQRAIDADPHPSGEELDRLEQDLHVTLLGYCANATMIAALTQHQSLLTAHRFFYRLTARMYPREPFMEEHLEIVVRLQRGDIAEAGEQLRDHLLASRRRAVERIGRIRGLVIHEPLAYLERLPD